MTTIKRLGTALAATVLLLGCDATSDTLVNAPDQGRADFEITCVRPPAATVGPFVAEGYFEDTGSMTGGKLPTAFDPQSMHREYEGQGYLSSERGSAVVYVTARAISLDPPHGIGTFSMAQGGGIYGVEGATGTYELTVDEDGNVVELFRGRVER